MMNPDDHHHDPGDLREPPGGDHGGHDYGGGQGGPAQLGIIFPAQAQVSEVGSPIDQGAGDYGMREAGTGNIGSIITMLIDEGNTVDIDDILTEEQCRQSHCQGGGGGSHQPKIKEEVEPGQMSYDGAAYQEFTFTGPEPQYRSPASTSQAWSHPAQSNESLITVPSLSMPRSLPVNCLPSPAAGARDDKYWERRRKNNLAAKKSRDTRRMRENQLRLRVLFLENANKVLREQMEKKDCESGKLRERLRLYESTDVNCHNNQ